MARPAPVTFNLQPSTMPPFDRILLIGYGSIGKRHLAVIRAALAQADIRVLRRKPGGSVPEEANGCFSNMEECWGFAPQAAVIANPAPFHVDPALSLARSGCHLLIEKPLAAQTERVPFLLQTAKEHGVVLQVGYNMRFMQSLNRFCESLQSRSGEKIVSIRCEAGQDLRMWRPGKDYRTGVSAQRELGGGVLLELSHELDYIHWIFGEVEWVSAWLGRASDLDIDVEDTAHLLLGLQRDDVVVRLDLDFARHDPVRHCQVQLSSGSVRWNALEGEVAEYYSASSGWQSRCKYGNEIPKTYERQWQHFMDCVQNRRAPLVGGEDGMAVLRIIEAARKSHERQGVRVKVGSSL